MPRKSGMNSSLSIIVAALAVLLGFFILRDISADNNSAPANTVATVPGETVTEETIAVETTAAPLPLT